MPEVTLKSSGDNMRWLLQFIWCGLGAMPFVFWQSSSAIGSYYLYGAPPGQIFYVFSKLFGLYAAFFLWLQCLSTLLRCSVLSSILPQWSLSRHRLIGTIVYILTVFHVVAFVTAVSLRKERFASDLLLPNFSDFYHGSITVGLFAFFTMQIAIGAALLRKHFPKVWRLFHRLILLVVLAGLLHSFLIGTETRYSLYGALYWFMFFSLFVSLLIWFKSDREKRLYV